MLTVRSYTTLVGVLALCVMMFGTTEGRSQIVFDQAEYVPNGGFEQLSRTEESLGGLWNFRYLQYARFWRQFNAALVVNDPQAVPLATDQVYGNGLPYDPVSCSTPDLLSYHLTTCGKNIEPFSVYDIPWNYFGYEPYRTWVAQDPDPSGRYAGSYYRLNAIQRNQVTGELELPVGIPNPAVDFWREYLEVELLCPLEAGTEYHVSYWVSLGEWSTRTLRVEARLSEYPYTTSARNVCNPVAIDGDDERTHVAIPTTAGGGVSACTHPQCCRPMDGFMLSRTSRLLVGSGT